MDSKAKVLGHSLHVVLVSIPLGLLPTSVLFDVIGLLTKEPGWPVMAFWLMVIGVGGGALAAVPGLIDWGAIPSGTRAKSVGLLHAISAAITLSLFAASALLRKDTPQDPSTLAVALSGVAFAVIGLTGWLGGELLMRHGVGVDDGAHLNARSSLGGRPAGED